ncbi:hypothetical protein PMAYCL1PPCAC_11315, partial [Pristionchus mayeri]
LSLDDTLEDGHDDVLALAAAHSVDDVLPPGAPLVRQRVQFLDARPLLVPRRRFTVLLLRIEHGHLPLLLLL